MRYGLFLLFALAACDIPADRGVHADNLERHQPVTKSTPESDLPSAPKLKPMVFEVGGAQAKKALECDVTVSFSSIGTGIDGSSRIRIINSLEEDAAVQEIDEFIVGREGESVLCVHLKPMADSENLFDKLSRDAANDRLVEIRSKGGKTFRSSN